MVRVHGWWFAVLVMSLGPASSASAEPPAGSSAFRLPTVGERWRDGFLDAAGPTALAGDAVSAALSQWVTGEPAEWADDGRGYARRFGVASATTAITEGSLALLAAAAREDAHYHRCPCVGVGPRAFHALRMTFMARGADGRAHLSAGRSVAPFIGPLVTRTTLYPARYTLADGAEAGAYAIVMNAGWNLAREFVLPARRW